MAAASTPALELRGIDKRFGAVHANRNIALAVAPGSVHGLVGENGAGKSTLMNIVYGYYPPDAGEIHVAGRPVQIRQPSDAIAAGIGMVHQHFMLVENMTVLENVTLGGLGENERTAVWPHPLVAGMPSFARLAVRLGSALRRYKADLLKARLELERLARDYGLEVPLDRKIEDLPVGLQQRVEILKALYRGARILILDEPTAVLTPTEADRLFEVLRVFKSQGKSVILVTHKLREVLSVTDRVAVMRQGAVVAEYATQNTSTVQLAEMMVGRPVALRIEKKPAVPGPIALSVRALEVKDRFGTVRVRSANFDLRRGEIVAIAGVAGNGQSELLSALAGLRPASAGQILLDGADVAGSQHGPAERRRLGLAYVPEDRIKEGILSRFSAQDNAILGRHMQPEYQQRFGLLSLPAIRRACQRKMTDWDVRPPDPDRRLGTFSGGNQQKLVLAREIEADPAVLIVGQPTRGVDIGAIEFIHRRLVQLRDAGKAVLVVSVELDEIMGLGDRILVMAGGEIVGELDRSEATEERIGLLMAGIRETGKAR